MNKKYIVFLIVFIMLLNILYSQPKEKYAVVCGISGYNVDIDNPIPPIMGMDLAAERFNDGLVAQDWDEGNINMRIGANATKYYINMAIAAMPKNSNTINAFYFGGHGSNQYGLYTYNVYINPYQSIIEYYSPAELEADFGNFNDYCVFLEACYSGQFADAMTSHGVICASSTASQPSAGPLGGGVGYFTKHLHKHMVYDDVPIGTLTAEDLFTYVAPLVSAEVWTARGITQTPQMQDNYPGKLLITTPAYDLSVNNSMIGVSYQGGVKVDAVVCDAPYSGRKYVETTANLEAFNQTINGIYYRFQHWEDQTTSYTRPVYMNTNKSIIASFQGKPAWSRGLTSSSAVGQPITITWTENPNPYVTYKIYRKVGKTGTAQYIASVGRGVCTYTDNDIVRTGDTSDPLISYDVRGYYSLEGTYSDENFQSIDFGEFLPKSDDGETEGLITEYAIENYPNPFNPTTVVRYQLPEAGQVNIKVYDMQGQEVAELVNEVKSRGVYAVQFNASHLASGTYFYVIRTNKYTETKKMMLVK